MNEVNIDLFGYQNIEHLLEVYPEMLMKSRSSALSSVGYNTNKEMKKLILSRRKKGHSVTKKGIGQEFKSQNFSPWYTQKESKVPFEFLSNLTKFTVSGKKTIKKGGVSVYFGGKEGKNKQNESSEMKDVNENDPLQKMVSFAQKGARISVGKNMRGLMGLTRKDRSGNKTGYILALKKTTTELKVPKRPMINPSFKRMRPRIRLLYSVEMEKSFDRQIERNRK